MDGKRDLRKRLGKLEEKKTPKVGELTGTENPVPDEVWHAAVEQDGWDGWYRVQREYGNDPEKVLAELRRVEEVNRRCDDEGFDSVDTIRDMLRYTEWVGAPVNETDDVLKSYPGPEPFWGSEGYGGREGS